MTALVDMLGLIGRLSPGCRWVGWHTSRCAVGKGVPLRAVAALGCAWRRL